MMRGDAMTDKRFNAVHEAIDDLSAKLTVLTNLVLDLSSHMEQIKDRLSRIEEGQREHVWPSRVVVQASTVPWR
jgi:hypothetical protein